MKLTELYESETGEKATYRKGSSDYHTLRYVRWLENRVNNIERHLSGECSGPDNSLSPCYKCHDKVKKQGWFICSYCHQRLSGG